MTKAGLGAWEGGSYIGGMVGLCQVGNARHFLFQKCFHAHTVARMRLFDHLLSHCKQLKLRARIPPYQRWELTKVEGMECCERNGELPGKSG